MYTRLELVCIAICTAYIVGFYIYLKVTSKMPYGLNWKRLFYEVRRGICIVLCKLFNK